MSLGQYTGTGLVKSVFITSTLQLAPMGVIFKQLKGEFSETDEDNDIAVHVLWAAPFNHTGQKGNNTEFIMKSVELCCVHLGFLKAKLNK